MCHFITLVVCGSDDASIAREVALHGRRAERIKNPSVEAILKLGEVQFLTTAGHCDCGTAIGATSFDTAVDRELLSRKLKKRGWSSSKVARSVNDTQKAEERAQERRERSRPDSIEQWTALIHGVLALPGVKQAGLLVHSYSKDVETEEFDAVRTAIGPNDFPERLRSLPDGQLMLVEQR